MTYAELVREIRESIKCEFEDYKYYLELAKKAPDINNNEIINGIARDKKEHAYVLKEAYFKLTGRMPMESSFEISDISDYKESLKERVLLETKDEEKFKNLYANTKIDWLRDIFFRIMHNENEYTTKLNSLIGYTDKVKSAR